MSVTGGRVGGGGCGLVPSDRPGATPGSKMLRASSVGATPSQLGDPTIEFLNGAIPPLSGTRHEYLTFSLRLHRPYDIGTGSVTRILWGSQSFADASVMTQTQDMRVWPGFNTYTIDLASLTPPTAGSSTSARPARRRRGRRAASASSASTRTSSVTPPPASTSTTCR